MKSLITDNQSDSDSDKEKQTFAAGKISCPKILDPQVKAIIEVI